MWRRKKKNGKPFVINEIRSSIHISTMLSFEGMKKGGSREGGGRGENEGLAEENVISPRYDVGGGA
jgi:hypothetical protein